MPQIKKLHPTLRMCKCGFIGTRSQLYKHLDHESDLFEAALAKERCGWAEYYKRHGEVPLNEDDPRVDTTMQLEQSMIKVHPLCPRRK